MDSSHQSISVVFSVRIYIQPISEDTRCSLKDPPRRMKDCDDSKKDSGKSVLLSRRDDVIALHEHLTFYLFLCCDLVLK